MPASLAPSLLFPLPQGAPARTPLHLVPCNVGLDIEPAWIVVIAVLASVIFWAIVFGFSVATALGTSDPILHSFLASRPSRPLLPAGSGDSTLRVEVWDPLFLPFMATSLMEPCWA